MLNPLSQSEQSYFGFLRAEGLSIEEIAYEQKCLRKGVSGPTTYTKVMKSDEPPTIEQISEFIAPVSFRNPLVHTLITALGKQPELATRFIATRAIVENANMVSRKKPLKLEIPSDNDEANRLPNKIIPGNHGVLASLLRKATSDKIIRPDIFMIEGSWSGDDVFPAVKQAERITIPNYSSNQDFWICLALGLQKSPSVYANQFSRLDQGELQIIYDLFKADGHEKALDIYMQLGQFYLEATKKINERDQFGVTFDFLSGVKRPDFDAVMNAKIKQLNTLILRDLSKK